MPIFAARAARVSVQLVAAFVLTGALVATTAIAGDGKSAAAFVAGPGCPGFPSDTARPTGTGQPPSVDYPVCADHQQRLQIALAGAAARKRLVLVEFGATWCSSCKSLRRQFAGGAILGQRIAAHDLATLYDVVSIPVSMVHLGRRAAVPSGEAALGDVLTRAPGAKLRAVPFLAVIERVWARNIDDLASSSTGEHDAKRIGELLVEAHDHVRGTGPAASEPGWLRRKLRRWLN
ncbi:MAG TPA: thioredoxin family protein [Hyphomicrobiaceae bacterium]|nr:thioredoxin family protein [Hyphomicrobiaceae bacterium]